MTDRKLSKHFFLKDLLVSQTASRRPDIAKLQFNPSEEIIQNLQLLCTNVLDRIQDHLLEQQSKLVIMSGYRCDELNKLIGGSSTSDHVKGKAADFVIVSLIGHDQKTAYKLLFDWIRNNLDFDQLIWEYGTKDLPNWLHVSYRQHVNRKQTLRIGADTNKRYIIWPTNK